IQCHDSFEHRVLGDLSTEDLRAITTTNPARTEILQRQIDLLKLWQDKPDTVTEEKVKALCPWIRTLTLPGSGLLVTYGELNALPDYIATADVADSIPAGVLLPILQFIRQEGYIRLSKLLGRTVTDPFQYSVFKPNQWLPGLINRLLESQALDTLTGALGIRGTDHYAALLGRNACHFAPFSWYRWQGSYLVACDLAKRAHQATDSALKARLTREAWVYHGYADHFLQDSFAAGHLVNKTLIMQWFLEWAATQPMVPVDNWDMVRNVTTAQQPGLAGRTLYGPAFAGGSNDPQTAEDQATYGARVRTTGVVAAAGTGLDAAYQNYLAFLASLITQSSSAAIHDHYNTASLWVGSVSHPAPFEIYGDDTLLSGANGTDGVGFTSQAAQMSQQSILDLLATGTTSITTQQLRDQFPTTVRDPKNRMLSLEAWNDTQKSFCASQIFPNLHDLIVRALSPTIYNISQDADFQQRWSTSLPGTGYEITSPLYHRQRVFAASNGSAFELDRNSGSVIHSLRLHGGGESTLAVVGGTLYVGVAGTVYGIDLDGSWSKPRWSASLSGAGSNQVAVIASHGRLFAGSNGYAYEIDPGTGHVKHGILLASRFGTGDYTTSLAAAGTTLFVGTHGYVYGIDVNNFSKAAWHASLPNAGYTLVHVLSVNGNLFAGSNGYAYRLRPQDGAVLHSLRVTDFIGVPGTDYTTRLATNGATLFVGTHGYVYAIDLAKWSLGWTANLAGNRYSNVNLLLSGRYLYAGSYGYVWRIDPLSGTVIRRLLLASVLLGPGDYETRLVDDGTGGALYLGVHGYADAVSILESAIWGVDTNTPATQNNIYRWDGSGWDPIDGYLTSMTVGPDGNVWGVNATQPATNDNIYRWNGAGWDGVNGYLTDIAVDGDGAVWGVNATQPATQNNIYRWNGKGWDGIGGYLTCVAVGGDGSVWGVNAKLATNGDNVFRWNGTGWDGVEGYLTDIAAGGDGAVWGVNATQPATQNNIYRWNGKGWDLIGGYLTCVAVGPEGAVWGTNATQARTKDNIYRWNGKGWDGVKGHLTSLAVG
ncbi:MAG: tectonin domain-containing protein, partial [Actinomycetota bacterium]